MPVSPGSQASSAAVEARCPTFQWSGVPAAAGYQLAVFRVSSDGAEPVLVTRASVAGDARGWTPPSSDCLERGGRYAWSVAAGASGAELAWSPPFLFEVEAAPSLEELEQAMATIERYRSQRLDDRPAPTDGARESGLTKEASTRPVRMRRPRSPGAAKALEAALPGALTSPTSGVTRVASEANTPTLGTPSLRVSANIALRATSALFKDDEVFLWDDTTGNTALGREALASVSGTASNNTAFGRRALQNTIGGHTSNIGSYNTAVGDGALRENILGHSNTATGYAALFSNTTGDSNSAAGYQALYSNTTGAQNSASGSFALFSNTTGDFNTASGVSALRSNTTGDYNTASGAAALRFNTTGSNNTASGVSALRFNTTGSNNTASGYYALRSNTTGTYNTASGASALRSNTTGSSNTASGFSALRSNTTGTYNTATGASALRSNTTGTYNTASGPNALRFNTIGTYNSASGYAALRYNTTGDHNTASGSGALFHNTTGKYNTASGHLALFTNTSGDRNTALGFAAGNLATTGDDNIFLGSGARSGGGEGHTIRIGGTVTGGADPGPGEQNRTFINGIRGITTAVDDAVPVLISASTGQLGTASSSRAVKQDIQGLGRSPISARAATGRVPLSPARCDRSRHAAPVRLDRRGGRGGVPGARGVRRGREARDHQVPPAEQPAARGVAAAERRCTAAERACARAARGDRAARRSPRGGRERESSSDETWRRPSAPRALTSPGSIPRWRPSVSASGSWPRVIGFRASRTSGQSGASRMVARDKESPLRTSSRFRPLGTLLASALALTLAPGGARIRGPRSRARLAG